MVIIEEVGGAVLPAVSSVGMDLIEVGELAEAATGVGLFVDALYETGKYGWKHRHALKRTAQNLVNISKNTAQANRGRRVSIDPDGKMDVDPPESTPTVTPIEDFGMAIIKSGHGGSRYEKSTTSRRRKRKPRNEIQKLKKKVSILMKDHGGKSYYTTRQFTPLVMNVADMATLVGPFTADASRACYFNLGPAFFAGGLQTELVKGKAQDGNAFPVVGTKNTIKDISVLSKLHLKNNSKLSVHVQICKYEPKDYATPTIFTELLAKMTDRGYVAYTAAAGTAASTARASLPEFLYSGGGNWNRHNDCMSMIDTTPSYKKTSKVMKFTLGPGDSIDIRGSKKFNYSPEDFQLNTEPYRPWQFGFIVKLEGELVQSAATPSAVGYADFNVIGERTDYLNWEIENELGEKTIFTIPDPATVSRYPAISDPFSVKRNVEDESGT